MVWKASVPSLGRHENSAMVPSLGKARVNQDIRLAIRRFIVENFVFRDDADVISDDQSLLDAGFIDSTGVLELVAFLEATFGIEVQDDEMLPENLDSIRAIAKFVAGKVASCQATRRAEAEQLAA